VGCVGEGKAGWSGFDPGAKQRNELFFLILKFEFENEQNEFK
jgi:hypothetical protein